MLGKLFKHEWKCTWKVGGMMLLGLVLVSFFGWFSFQAPMWQSLAEGGSRFSWVDIFSILTLIMYVMMLTGINYGLMIYLGVHFYQTMYTDQGYLVHTLPVTKHQILFSKILISGLWIFLVMLTVYLSVGILGVSMISRILPGGYSLSSIWREIGMDLGTFIDLLGEELNFDIIRWLVIVLLMSLVSPFVTVTILFGAISIGQLFGKHRVLMAILCYIGIMVAVNIVTGIIRSFATVSGLQSFGNYVNTTMDSTFIINLLLAVGLYFVSWHVTNNRLNMQ